MGHQINESCTLILVRGLMVKGYRHPETAGTRSKTLIYLVLLISYVLTAAIFYGIYSTLEPLFQLPTPQPSATPTDTSPASQPLLYVYLLLLYSAFRTTPALLYFFLIFILLVFLNEISYILLAVLHRYLSGKRLRPIGKWRSVPMVSIIVPAYNEEKVIGDTILSLLELDYPRKEIIVVNDGSTDGTEQVVTPYVRKGQVQLVNRPNGGKAVALNTGIAFANGEIIVCTDADSVVERAALTKLVANFQNPRVVAVAGNVKVGNRVNLLTNLQALEYVREINLRRRAFDLLNTVYVVPGAVGAFRKSAYQGVGWYDKDTVTEDMDVTVKFVKTGDLVLYESRAVAHTEAPENLRGWLRQRIRWFGGSLQTVAKHRVSWWRFGALGFVGLPYLLLSMIIVPVVELTALVVALVYSALGMWFGVTLAFLVAIGIEFACSILSVFIDQDDPKLILYTPIYVLVYRYLSDIVRMKCYWDMFRGKLGWARTGRYGGLVGKIKRIT